MKEPLFYNATAYEYYIELSVGTPPQDLLVVMDTGSSVVWAACTPNYTCTPFLCPGYTTVFLPNKSSSALPVQCADPKCRDVCEEGVSRTCPDKCSGTCPDYFLLYGSGSANGHLLTDTLTLPSGSGHITKFGFGCSVTSQGIAGIAGFGRGKLSLPSQLSVHKFAYCLNDQNNGSVIVLGDRAVPTNMSLNYTPFLNNSVGYNEFYYIGIQGVSIGGKYLRLPSTISTIDNYGNGGTIIDSGTTLTSFPVAVVDQIKAEFSSQIRYPEVQPIGFFVLCYNVSGVAHIQFPKFSFHFSSGSVMVLPEGNCFMPQGNGTYCLAFSPSDMSRGPAAILGSYQSRNLYILYDTEMNRLGFTQRAC